MMRLLTVLVVMLAVSVGAMAAGPKIAFWDPEMSVEAERFAIDLDYLKQAAAWMK